MNKDVLYLDIEDDITTIVGKIKSAKHAIVALVPPKRIGVLQSAVNMRLITRAAEQSKKRVVLITNDAALSGLAAAAKIPVAKNLQSKPELADVPVAQVDDSDVIDGRELPVGELARTGVRAASRDVVDEAIAEAEKKAGAAAKVPLRASAKPTPKVPDFNMFRKKFVLIGGGIVLLIGFLVWAIKFAPHATVIIAAKTATVTVNDMVTLKLGAKTDPQAQVIQAIRQEHKKELSVEFTATGKKKVGDKATGTMQLQRTRPSSKVITIPAGTTFSAGDYTFVSTEPATLAGTRVGEDGLIQDTAKVRVQAAQVGDEYNLSARAYTSTVGGFTATGSAMSGGTSREVTVINKDDMAKATEKLNEVKDDSLRDELLGRFGPSMTVVTASYQEQRAEPTTSVPIETEVTGPVKLKTMVTASAVAVDKAELRAFVTARVAQQLETKQSQKIYDDGVDKVTFAQVARRDDAVTARITANASVGPSIDEVKVREQARGKSYGDIQASLEAIEGINDVDTKFWPFWVRTVPANTNRITIEFKLENGS